MLISDISIKKPVFGIVINLILVILGIISYAKLQIRSTPNIDQPVVSINSIYQGADSAYMESQVTNRIEESIKTLKNVDFVSSSSGYSSSIVNIIFKLDTDIEIALNDVRDKVSKILSDLPKNMDSPIISKVEQGNFPSIWISINSNKHNLLELTRIVENQVETVLERLPTVGEIQTFGRQKYAMIIEPRIVDMYSHTLSNQEIVNSIKSQNQNFPIGTIETRNKNFIVKLNSEMNQVEDFEKIIVKTYKNGAIIKLKDVADIKLDALDVKVLLKYNGINSLGLGLVLKSGANVIDLADQTNKAISELNKILPDSVKINIAYDQSIPVKESIDGLLYTIFEAIILVTLVIYLFLGSVVTTLIPLMTIPISLIATCIIIQLLGFTLNIFTLLAMMLAIGLVIDDAVVVLENITRHFVELKKSPIKAALEGSQEVGFAVIAMTITLAAVFLPIGFLEGMIGKLFIEFAWTLAFCILFSGMVALTLTPLMSSRLVNTTTQTKITLLKIFDKYLLKLQNQYIILLKKSLNNKKIAFVSIALSIIVIIFTLKVINTVFVPEEDQGFIILSYEGPEGSTLNKTDSVVLESQQILNNHPDIESYLQVSGYQGENTALAFIILKDWNKRKKSQQQIVNELNLSFSSISSYMSIFAKNPRSLGNSGADVIAFYVQSSGEYSKIEKISEQIMNEMHDSKIFTNISSDFDTSTPGIDVVIEKNKAHQYGISVLDIANELRYTISDNNISDFIMGNNIYDVVLHYNKKNKNTINILDSILVKNNQNQLIPVGSLIKKREHGIQNQYSHYNNLRSIKVTANINKNFNIGIAINALNKILTPIIETNNITIEYGGEIKQLNDSGSDFLFLFPLAIVFIYLILSIQFNNFLDPLIVLFAVPFSMAGGVVSLYIFNNSLNMYSNIGLITLIGLIAKNSVMIVEFANQLNDLGKPILESIIESAKLRLRPILMTTIATILGAIPLAMSSGSGAAARNSIGLVITGGMSIGTICSLIIIPMLYYSLKNK
ncbi:efflux RND transporter permease subunit [Rickettsia endosymbiont of Cardiosporidium cionae]|uniref:efflux RND transporter permease subunit n=1 Tax=Rickettsia endosymbiont of Cardiosporidium cionae TaxID=2777155 RepID=UPI001895E3AB|nr:efflux RND transporter permease subunit [Rickettsia endosymbiont of Cardiosporidium cionae]KAF8818873.1 AcrB/AcrD/AcrF family protein [Rickettsia endosymbiont of Cardiosporidium cionae]